MAVPNREIIDLCTEFNNALNKGLQQNPALLQKLLPTSEFTTAQKKANDMLIIMAGCDDFADLNNGEISMEDMLARNPDLAALYIKTLNESIEILQDLINQDNPDLLLNAVPDRGKTDQTVEMLENIGAPTLAKLFRPSVG